MSALAQRHELHAAEEMPRSRSRATGRDAVGARPLRVFVFPSTYDCANVGDIAMLQMAISRVKETWPNASFDIVTRDAQALHEHCPDARAVFFDSWFADHFLLGSVHDRLPRTLSQRVIALKHAIRASIPALEDAAIAARLLRHPGANQRYRALLSALQSADLFLVSGASGPNDTFPGFARALFALLQRAIGMRKPCVVMGSAIGPINDPALGRLAGSILPKVDLISLREKLIGAPLLASVGVNADRVVVTGDDAVELSYSQRSMSTGTALGVNVRTMEPAHVGQAQLAVLANVIESFVSERGCEVVALPIACRKQVDALAIQQVARGLIVPVEPKATPMSVIRRTAACRVVLTGAYHAAVFALSQGIPAVCVSNSRYFFEKFRGLQDMFGAGCQIVSLESPQAAETLSQALAYAWENASAIRPTLLSAAQNQIEAGQRAYRRIRSLVEAAPARPDRTATALQ